MIINFHRLAAQELRMARHWYAERSVAVASRFVAAVETAVERILLDPQAHPCERKHFRWVRVRRFAYRLIFEQADTTRILIIAVAHASRRPGYWSQRR